MPSEPRASSAHARGGMRRRSVPGGDRGGFPVTRSWLALPLWLAAAATESAAQMPAGPAPADPARPRTRVELDRREALKLYARGLLLERDSRLVEAVQVYEEAVRLDP